MPSESTDSTSTPLVMKTAALKNTHFHVLNVPFDASSSQIRKAYLALAKKYHPDVTSSLADVDDKESTEKMQQVVEAYRVLSGNHLKNVYLLSLFIELPFGNMFTNGIPENLKGSDMEQIVHLPTRRNQPFLFTVKHADGTLATVTIPAGMKNGQRVRIKGYGEAGEPNGDLFLLIAPPVNANRPYRKPRYSKLTVVDVEPTVVVQ